MTPIASIGGRSWMIFPWGAGISAETAWVTGAISSRPDAEHANQEAGGLPLPPAGPKAQVSEARPAGVPRAAR